MAVKKRQCGTCRFFVQSDSPGFGKCTNPAWPESSAPLLLLRPNELACRTRWGTSLWRDPNDASDPGIAAAPQQPSLPEPTSVQLQYDDEVTSVSIAGSARARSSFDDDVVDTSAVVPSSLTWEDDLQSERRELLRQSPHDALAGARKRHMDKQARQRELIPFAENESPEEKDTPTEEVPVISSAANAKTPPVFPPDDFVEQERGTAEDVYDDELVDEGVPGIKRSPRLNHLLKSPKNDKAMTLGAASEMSVTSHNPERREQWNTVPQIQPGFDLPLVETEPTPSPMLRVNASAAPMMSSSPVSRPVSVAREVYSEDRKQIERAQRRVEVPLAEHVPTAERTMLSHAPSNQTPLVERIRSSPLRGYRPAPKPETQQPTQQPRRSPEVAETSSPRRTASEHVPTTAVQPQERSPQQQQKSPEPAPEMRARPQESVRQAQPVDRTPVSETPEERQSKRRSMIPLHVDTSPFVSKPVQLAPHVPRCCGTCSSYRGSDVPGRGSCTNQHAGPLRRMVSDTDLACEHTWGTMWVPADDQVWLTDLPDHSGPTPRVDAMLKRRERSRRPVLPDLEELTS